VVGLETGVEELRELMPKAITIPPHGQGVEGAWNLLIPPLASFIRLCNEWVLHLLNAIGFKKFEIFIGL
jgi:hypothetical protein